MIQFRNFMFFFPLLLFSCSGQKADKMPKLPNIILICADDLGWSDIGCYGSEVLTPNLDKLGEGGMRFTNFYNTSKCFPSRASLLTGVYAQQCGYDKTHTNRITNAVTLGEVLRTAGYRTMWSGKHHGPENPVFRGFDRYYGLRDGACNYFNPGEQRNGEGAPARKGKPGNKTIRAWCIDSVTYMPYTPEEKDFYTTDYYTNYALQWIEEYKDEENPFFLYLAYTAPHDPLMAWPEDIERYKGRYNEGYAAIREARYKKQRSMGLTGEKYKLSESVYQSWEDLSEEERADEIKRMEVYAAMIDRLDQNIGRVIKKLEETGRIDNTLILFVSDNGASAEVVSIEDDYGEIGTLTRWESLGGDWANVGNTPFRYYKNYSYEGGINSPLIAWWPGKIEAGSISGFRGHFIDFMPTFVELTGARYPQEFNGQPVVPMQGQSLLPVFQGQQADREKPLFWEWSQGQAVYHNSWKLVRHGLNKSWELYNLNDDPVETMNMAVQQPDKKAELEKLFMEWKEGLAD